MPPLPPEAEELARYTQAYTFKFSRCIRARCGGGSGTQDVYLGNCITFGIVVISSLLHQTRVLTQWLSLHFVSWRAKIFLSNTEQHCD